MQRKATKAEVLEAFRSRLRDVCPGCAKTGQCFISDQPVPEGELFPSISHFVTVSAGAGSFDQSMFVGGGAATLNQDFQLVVTPIVQMNLDRLPAAEKRMLHISRGLTTWEQNILSSILLDNPNNPNSVRPWDPEFGDRKLLRNLPMPVHTSDVFDVPNQLGYSGISITFSVSFDWRLGIVTPS
ncbi:MAG: hypothetical protein U0930_04740 [Pirellulales bacterium]